MPPNDYFPPQLIPMIPFLVWAANNVKPNNPGWGYEAKKIIKENWPPNATLPPDFEPPEWTKQSEPASQGMGDFKPGEGNRNLQNEEKALDYVTDIVYPWG